MVYRFLKNTFLFLFIGIAACGNNNERKSVDFSESEESDHTREKEELVLGAQRTQAYLPLLKNKTVGIVGNQTSLIGFSEDNPDRKQVHLVDSLVSLGVEVVKVFAPEHGFRGTADAGEVVKDGTDVRTGLPIISLYGENKKPSNDQLGGIEVMVFDIQDVGTRFYTYISTLHYVMEACAENDIPLMILDRPNPNGHYIDGPILEPKHQSFVGMHPIPVVHGLTIGEYARMINGEQFLAEGIQADLEVIEMENYTHDLKYELPVKPSPNLPNARAINLYPSLCFFEGTNVNAGRGTQNQFQVFGSPFLDPELFTYTYTPQSNDGAKSPKHLGKNCYGKDLTEAPYLDEINLEWLITAYAHTADKSKFFNSFFTKLAGTTQLQEQIEAGMSAEEIEVSWEPGLEKFQEDREKYLLYE